MYKLITVDFDGTLIDSEESIPLSTVLLIDKLRRSGIKFVISTGRILQSVLEYNKDFHFIDYIIACNGAAVYNVSNKKLIYEKKLTKKIIKTIEKKFSDYIIYFCVDQDWLLYQNGMIEGELFEDWLKRNQSIRKIEVHFQNQKEALKIEKVLADLNLDITYNIAHYGENTHLIEINGKNNKYIGLQKVLKETKTNKEEVIAIGDSYNDIPLLSQIETSIAMENAVKEVKKAAKYKTESNNDKGVEKAISKIMKNL